MSGVSSTISGAQQHESFAEQAFPNPPSWTSGGWKTRQMFKRYAITDTKDVADAIDKREQAETQNGHDFSRDLDSSGPSTTKDSSRIIN
jgi:hypothetical protein